jgi:hypothetical protein
MLAKRLQEVKDGNFDSEVCLDPCPARVYADINMLASTCRDLEDPLRRGRAPGLRSHAPGHDRLPENRSTCPSTRTCTALIFIAKLIASDH